MVGWCIHIIALPEAISKNIHSHVVFLSFSQNYPMKKHNWLVVSTPLKNICQLG